MSIPKFTASKGLLPASNPYAGEPETTLPSLLELPTTTTISPQGCACGGGSTGTCSCGSKAASKSFVYAIGRIQASFPSLSLEKEFFQAIELPLSSTEPLTVSLLFNYLSKSENFYIAREMCWLLQKDGVDIYVLLAPSYSELTGLIGSIAPRLGTWGVQPILYPVVDWDVIIGKAGPLAPPEVCNGKELSMIICDQAFNFTDEEYVEAIFAELQRRGISPSLSKVRDVFYTIIRIADNTGDKDEYRAVNFLVIRYIEIYVQTYILSNAPQTKEIEPPPLTVEVSEPELVLSAGADPLGYDLSKVSVQPSPIQGEDRIMEVIFVFVGRGTNTIKRYFCRVNVTGEFPSLSIPWNAYFSHP